MYTSTVFETLRHMHLFLKIQLYYYAGDIYEVHLIQALYLAQEIQR